MKMLNLDELVTVKRTVKFKGVQHEIKELGVGAFLEAIAAAEAKKLESKEDVANDLEETIKQITRVIPTLPESELREMTFDQLFTLVRFCNGTLDELKKVGETVAAEQASEAQASGN